MSIHGTPSCLSQVSTPLLLLFKVYSVYEKKEFLILRIYQVATLTVIHSFRSAPSKNLLRGALSPATAKEKCLKKLAERRDVPGQQAQCKRKFIPSGGANDRESSLRAERA